MTTYAHIVGWGKYLPEKVVTNHDIATFIDTSDEWIKSRTGISERRFVNGHETTTSMAITAARLALDQAGLAPSAVDLIIVATFSQEYLFPSTACLVQDALGAKNAGAYDLGAACSGFIYALSTGAAMIRSGLARVVLVIGAETTSRFLDEQDVKTYPLFGDGAGAVVLQADERPGGVLSTVLGADGSGAEYLSLISGGCKNNRLPHCPEDVTDHLQYLRMDGPKVYRFAIHMIGQVVQQVCDKIGIGLNEIDLFIPHQANLRIIESACNHLKISQDKVFTNLHKYGNTGAASIPIAFCEAIEEDRIQNKDKLVLVGVGGGLTWGATVVEWNVPLPGRNDRRWYLPVGKDHPAIITC